MDADVRSSTSSPRGHRAGDELIARGALATFVDQFGAATVVRWLEEIAAPLPHLPRPQAGPRGGHQYQTDRGTFVVRDLEAEESEHGTHDGRAVGVFELDYLASVLPNPYQPEGERVFTAGSNAEALLWLREHLARLPTLVEQRERLHQRAT